MTTFLAEFTARPCTVKNIGISKATTIRPAQILVDEDSRHAILEQMDEIRLREDYGMGSIRVGS